MAGAREGVQISTLGAILPEISCFEIGSLPESWDSQLRLS